MDEFEWWDDALAGFDSGQMWADDILFSSPDPGATPYNVAVDYGSSGGIDELLQNYPSGYSDIYSDPLAPSPYQNVNPVFNPAQDSQLANEMLSDPASGGTPPSPSYQNTNPVFRPSQDSELANQMLSDPAYVASNPALQGFVNDAAAAPPAPPVSPAVPTNASGSTWDRLLSALATPGGLAALLAGAGMLAEGRGGGGGGAATGAGLFKGTVPKYRATRTEMPERPTNAQIRNFATEHINNPRLVAGAMEKYGLTPTDMGRAAPEVPQETIDAYFRNAGIQNPGRRPGSAPLRYFSGVNYQPMAAGGLVGLAQQQAQPFPMQSNGFVLPADVVSALGNGSSRAGAERVRGMLGGGRVIDGPGDGQSDSIPAHIDGRQPAAVARDEVYLSPQEVARLGGGNTDQGVAALHRLMDNVRQQAYGHTRQQRPVDPRKIV